MGNDLIGKTALLIVDVQNDFCEGGALGVQGGLKVANDLSSWLNHNAKFYDLIVASRDWHEADSSNAGHFSDDPDFVDSWPSHCVQFSYGAQYADNFNSNFINVHIVKGMGVPAYSAFDGVVMGHKVSLDDVLMEHDIVNVDVVGLAFDYCVKASAIDAAKLNYNTVVLKDFVASVHPENDDEIMKLLENSGVRFINLED